jgi:hypothetical protein
MSNINNSKLVLSQENRQHFILCIWLIVSIAILHRAFILITYSTDLHALVANNPSWLTWQFPTVQAMTEHFLASILYLQQTPPIPTVILAFIIQVFGWPQGSTFALIAFQALISMGTTLLLFSLLCTVTQKIYLSCILAISFLMSTDLLVMEYNSFGQTFYENLAMFLLMAHVYLFWKFFRTNKLQYVLLAGIFVSLLALSRASFSYFFIVPFLFLLFNKAQQREYGYALLVFCIGLIPHLLWCAKNYIVYDTPSFSTSSWRGINFAVGFAKRGNGEKFVESILQENNRYPTWFITMLKEHGLVHWQPEIFANYIPQKVRDQDAAIQKLFSGSNTQLNSIGQRIISDIYMKAFVRFFIHNPVIVIQGLWRSYALFWQPIRNYSTMFLAPLFITPPQPTYLIELITYFEESFIGHNQFFMTGLWSDKIGKPIKFFTLPTIPGLIHILTVIVMHFVVPIVAVFGIISTYARYQQVIPIQFFFILSTYLYLAIVSNIAEYGENMRFRLGVEPVIWLITIWSLILVYPLAYKLILRIRQSLRKIVDANN